MQQALEEMFGAAFGGAKHEFMESVVATYQKEDIDAWKKALKITRDDDLAATLGITTAEIQDFRIRGISPLVHRLLCLLQYVEETKL